jgi:hypothetical protein
MTIIAGFCPKCGGWTMFITTDSPNARQWTQMSYVAGDLIMPIRDAVVLDACCPFPGEPLDERPCDL